MTPHVRDAIIRASKENGLDPSMALAIADRESSGDVNAGSGSRYSSAYGLFQLLKSERGTYGGNSTDPYEQATAWAHYIKGTQSEMERGLGRAPTGPELYLGHYFGGGRAARLVSGKVPGQTPVQAIFSSTELAANPNIGRAGTTGALSSSIMSDIARRQQKFAGAGGAPDAGNGAGDDPADWGTPVGSSTARGPEPAGGAAKPITFAQDTSSPVSRPAPPVAPPLTPPPQQSAPEQPPIPPPMQTSQAVPFAQQQSVV